MILASSARRASPCSHGSGRARSSRDRDLGFVLPSDMEHQIYEAIKDLKIGELSGLVETKKGVFLFKRTE